MHTVTKQLALSCLLTVTTLARDVPSNSRSLYNNITARGQCSTIQKCGFFSVEEGGSNDFCYCGDNLGSDGIIYLQGSGGNLANMDIDCNGRLSGGDGHCDRSGDSLYNTHFSDIIRGYNKVLSDLNPYIHSFVTFGNTGNPKRYVPFDPQSIGIQPYSIMAVVCGDKLVYGIWGDVNGDDGPPLVGEASYSVGKYCYGCAVNGAVGHDANDVLYIACTGHGAVPGADGAAWNASSFEEFEQSLQAQGDDLIARISGS